MTQTAVDLRPMHAKGLTLHVVFVIEMLRGIGRAQHGAILREAGEWWRMASSSRFSTRARFTFDQAGRARHLESGTAVGKIVIDVAT